jgi:nitroreductase
MSATGTNATAEQVRHVVQAAVLAPSVHNTQPWVFVTRRGALELHADLQRRLEVLDPDGRQLHLSCGAALFHARVAARALGLDVTVNLLPDPTRPTHLADLLLTRGERATDEEVGVATAILRRHTYRGAFEARQLPGDLIEELQRDAEAENASLHVVTSEDQLIELEVLLARADAAEEADGPYRDELRRWTRDDATHPDGIPLTVLRSAPGSSLRQRDFALTHEAAIDGSAPPADHPVVVVLASDDDSPAAWLHAGQALAAVLLRAAGAGVQAQPLGQVTDVLAYRLGLRGSMGLMSMPQLVLRIGYAPAPAAAPTPRRPVEDVLAVAQSVR